MPNRKKSFTSVVDKVKSYILCTALQKTLQAYSPEDVGDTVELGQWKESSRFDFDQSILRQIKTPKQLQICYSALKQKVSEQLGVFDSGHFCENALGSDQIWTTQVPIPTSN
jgi:hypothetical protein